MTKLFAISIDGSIITRKPRPMSELAPVARKMAQEKDAVLQVVQVDANNQPVAETPSRNVDVRVRNSEEYKNALVNVPQMPGAIPGIISKSLELTQSQTGYVPKPLWKARQGMALSIPEIAYVLVYSSMVEANAI